MLSFGGQGSRVGKRIVQDWRYWESEAENLTSGGSASGAGAKKLHNPYFLDCQHLDVGKSH